MIPNQARRAPHQGTNQQFHHAPNAALLIDFDNVTMGIRSDLGKELKSLLNSEVIRGKVAVQRAYADWRRYPQYIVPLAESSIDLIFAPAYGSSKKNATDLRMAIDAMELVFTRPEIGTFILMTGDSDFSSCVLKLKEYGKYVIGVGMRESSSDLLIQNCDEYYSYHSLSGLTRAGEEEESAEDPWVLLRRSVERMVTDGDVMRTDRLKQVMLDIDPAFDEKKLGYSKFSRFVSEASTKGLINLRRGENGQYEISVPGQKTPSAPAAATTEPRGNGRRGRGRGGSQRETPATPAPAPAPIPTESEAKSAAPAEPASPLSEKSAESATAKAPGGVKIDNIEAAYGLLQQAVRALVGTDGAARDGDVKRRMLDMVPEFDESNLGFSKFTRFLRQAHDKEVVDLNRAGGGNYEVSLPSSGPKFEAPVTTPAEKKPEVAVEKVEKPKQAVAEIPKAPESKPAAPKTGTAGAPARRGRRGRGGAEGPPPLLPGQVVSLGDTEAAPSEKAPAAEEPAKKATRTRKPKAPAAKKKSTTTKAKGKAPTRKKAAKAAPLSAADLGLPRDRASIEAYLTNSYKGVGKKTAETLLDGLGDDIFVTLERNPKRVRELLGKRADALLEQWDADLKRRRAASVEAS
ncbi:MAG TPA: NYN domain-containing protein [Longimicrobiaceae bacterium]|nr:NYN domain-containing protein [Longimicrobiaceae bacterium]